MTREQNLQMQASARIYQQRYDDVLQPWGVRAPAPTLGQDIDKYTRDLAVKAKSLLPDNHQLKKVQYRGLPSDAFEGYEPQLLRAVRTVATDNSTVPYDQPLRRIEDTDANGLKVIKWLGQRWFGHHFTREGRRVTSFMTYHGRVNASGQPVR